MCHFVIAIRKTNGVSTNAQMSDFYPSGKFSLLGTLPCILGVLGGFFPCLTLEKLFSINLSLSLLFIVSD